MRNGPQTWPLCGHEFLDWLQPSDGEISPRQYTALIRRASSLHYRPELLYPLDIVNGYHSRHTTCVQKNNTTHKNKIPKHHSHITAPRNNLINKQNTRNNHTKTTTDSAVELLKNNTSELTKKSALKCKKSAGSLKSKSNNLSNEFNKLKISCGQEKPCTGRQNKQTLHLKLAKGSHMSESSDFCTKELIEVVKAKDSRRVTEEEGPRGRGSTGKLESDLVETAPQAASLNIDQSVHLPRVNLSETRSPFIAQTEKPHVFERPYYDCGYDTDYDSTPPHSGSECDDGKLKLILDSSPVWSRYMAWLQRMTKTQC